MFCVISIQVHLVGKVYFRSAGHPGGTKDIEQGSAESLLLEARARRFPNAHKAGQPRLPLN